MTAQHAQGPAEISAGGRATILGVLNVTPDSFSDGGRYRDTADAVEHGVLLRSLGADVVDVGGESTRPGADRVVCSEEKRRVLPVIRQLAERGVPVSVDTTRSEVAAAAISAGAVMVNDVSGGRADPEMARVIAESDAPWVLMHWRGHSAGMQRMAEYTDVVAEVCTELQQQVDAAVAAGVAPERLLLDPGLGFAKTAEHNWQLLQRLDRLVDMGLPVLIGASRKRFLGALLGRDQQPRPPEGREVATAAVSALAAAHGAWGVRVHDVASSWDAVTVAAAWRPSPQHGGVR